MAKAISRKVSQFIKFPMNEREITLTKQEFYNIKEFPNVIGAIDGTHVEIVAPNNDIEGNWLGESYSSMEVTFISISRLYQSEEPTFN